MYGLPDVEEASSLEHGLASAESQAIVRRLGKNLLHQFSNLNQFVRP
jgi:hypothetical protein